MITLDHVTQHYGVRPILRDIHLNIDAGELVAIIGPNGMGKSTLLASMAGVLQPQRGFIEINGLRRRSSIEAELEIRQQTVYLPDYPWLPVNRTGREYLLGVGRLYGIENHRLVEHVERLLALFELEEVGDSPIRTYSAGQKKKVSLSAALVTEATILLLDEPFSGGLDPSGIMALKRVMQSLAQSEHVTVVMTAPVPELVEELADRIVVFLAPACILLIGSLLPLLLIAAGLPWELAYPLTLSALILATSGLGPSLARWHLTGNHRIVPAEFGQSETTRS